MLPYLTVTQGNPSSVHESGRAARAAVDQSRDRIAAVLACAQREIVFTGSGTEADNLAVRGVLERWGAERGRHIVVSAIEHDAVLETARHLEETGLATVTIAGCDRECRVDPEAVAEAVTPETVLVSVMFVNNETGAIQDIAAIADAVHRRNPRTLVHTDAVQAFGRIPFHPRGARCRPRVRLRAQVVRTQGSWRAVDPPRGRGRCAEHRWRTGTQPPQRHRERRGDRRLRGGRGAGRARARGSKGQRQVDLCSRLIAGVREQVPDAIVTAADCREGSRIRDVRVPRRSERRAARGTRHGRRRGVGRVRLRERRAAAVARARAMGYRTSSPPGRCAARPVDPRLLRTWSRGVDHRQRDRESTSACRSGCRGQLTDHKLSSSKRATSSCVGRSNNAIDWSRRASLM